MTNKMSNYETTKKCPYYIADGVLYYTTLVSRKVYSRQMTPEIDRIFNTVRPVLRKNNCVKWLKLIYENELHAINLYVMGKDKQFTHKPPYQRGREIIRYIGEVPTFRNGEQVTPPTYNSPEYDKYLRQINGETDAQKQKKQKRREYMRHYRHNKTNK